jgi:hypothetical protein
LLKSEAVFVCDDARREDTGKLLMVGVYGQDIRVAEFPADLVLTFVIRARCTRAFDTRIDFRVLFDDVPKGSQTGHVRINQAGTVMFSVTNIPIGQIAAAGVLSLQWKLDATDWETIFAIPVSAGVPMRPS